MSKLEEICARKQEHIEAQKSKESFDDLKYKVADLPPSRGFMGALMNKMPLSLIAEVKKASPSKGVIRANFDPVEIAKAYEKAGAACVSVLTDEPFFQGADEHLTQIKEAVSLPVLRKDFMLDEYQIYESRALGADCILLIMAALDDDQVKSLYAAAEELRMDVLVEVHDQAELERTLALNPAMIGINNRDLKTLEVDIQTSQSLAASIPDHIFKVSESGIGSHEDIESLQASGFRGFLVGESLMKQDNIEEAVRNLITK